MGQMFYNCSGIKTLYLNKFNVSKVKKMSYLFYKFNSKGTVTINKNAKTKICSNKTAKSEYVKHWKYV